ncbi:MAG: ABC transporter permease [Chloroflexi bacterium]|jgi:ABC-2 type transport system permease protein|nr:ABC transporter permease [Chloroflexota bacterium]MBT7080535.1 ABC transporter permease [Chloroflexota bacterium]
MKALLKLSWVELKLFIREPITMFFTLGLPIIILFVMGEVFGNIPDTNNGGTLVWDGIGPMDFYTPAYIGLVMTAIGLMSIPVHLTGYRERGILRRLRASSISIWTMLGSRIIVSLVVAIACALILTLAAWIAYDIILPQYPAQLVVAFAVSIFCFSTLGIFLGAIFKTARAAQGIGLILFFVMMMLSGAGPPPEEMSDLMLKIADFLPMTHVVKLMQESWFGSGWNWAAFGIVAGIAVGATTLSVKHFRWD